MLKAGSGRRLANQPKVSKSGLLSPLELPDLLSWYDFADPTVAIDDGFGNLQAVYDKGPYGADAIIAAPYSTYPYIDLIGSRSCYYFYTDHRLEAWYALYGDITAYVVARYPSDTSFWTDSGLLTSADGTTYFQGLYSTQIWDASYYYDTYTDGHGAPWGAIGDYDCHIYSTRVYSGGFDILLVGGSPYGDTNGWDGQIGEVLIFQSIHSAVTMNKVGKWLSRRWNKTWNPVSY